MEDRLITSTKNWTDAEIENSLRPTSLNEYVGQKKVKESLDIYIKAAKSRKDFLLCDNLSVCFFNLPAV